MKKTMWATGLLVSVTISAAWSNPFTGDQEQEDPSSPALDGTLLEDISQNPTTTIYEERVEGIPPAEVIESIPKFPQDPDVIRLGLYECYYSINDSTQRRKALVKGLSLCSAKHAESNPVGDLKKLEDIITSHAGDYVKPTSGITGISCTAVVSDDQDADSRSRSLKDYIKLIKDLPSGQLASGSLTGDRRDKADTAQQQIENELRSTVIYADHGFSGTTEDCGITLVLEDEYAQSGGAVSALKGVGTKTAGFFKTGAAGVTGVVWVVGDKLVYYWNAVNGFLYGGIAAYLTEQLTTMPEYHMTMDRLVFGNNPKELEEKAGGINYLLLKLWNYPLCVSSRGTEVTPVKNGLFLIGAFYAGRRWGPRLQEPFIATLGTARAYAETKWAALRGEGFNWRFWNKKAKAE